MAGWGGGWWWWGEGGYDAGIIMTRLLSDVTILCGLYRIYLTEVWILSNRQSFEYVARSTKCKSYRRPV